MQIHMDKILKNYFYRANFNVQLFRLFFFRIEVFFSSLVSSQTEGSKWEKSLLSIRGGVPGASTINL